MARVQPVHPSCRAIQGSQVKNPAISLKMLQIDIELASLHNEHIGFSLLCTHRGIIVKIFARLGLVLPELLPIAGAQGQHSKPIIHIDGAVRNGGRRELTWHRDFPELFPIAGAEGTTKP